MSGSSIRQWPLRSDCRPSTTSPAVSSARDELIRGVRSPRCSTAIGDADGGVRRRGNRHRHGRPGAPGPPSASVPTLTKAGAFWLGTTTNGRRQAVVVAGRDQRGVLYGAFALLRHIALHDPIDRLDDRQEPAAPVGGPTSGTTSTARSSEAMRGRRSSSRTAASPRTSHAPASTRACSRRSASTAAPSTTSTPTARADRTGVRAAACPHRRRVPSVGRRAGDLDRLQQPDERSADSTRSIRSTRESPHSGRRASTTIYGAIPDFGGFVLKADSEGRLGPSAYGRTHADAANVVARALEPHGGVLFYRGFVYDHLMDWRNAKNDRARAAVDNFKPSTASSTPTSSCRSRTGPIDFQVREPASPLFAALERTSEAIELQITQEYLGQQRTSCSCRRCGRRRSTSTCSATIGRRRSSRSSRDTSACRTSGGSANWLAPRSRDGESLRFRPPCLESGDHARADRARVDRADLRRTTRAW